MQQRGGVVPTVDRPWLGVRVRPHVGRVDHGVPRPLFFVHKMLQLAILLMFLPLITWQCQPLELAVIMAKELKFITIRKSKYIFLSA